MAIGDLAIFSALRTKMKWHEARQRLLAQNIANADTPGYVGRDLKPLKFGRALSLHSAEVLRPQRTDANHLEGNIAARSPFRDRRESDFEVTPDANGVVLEEEMMKVTTNQLDFQTVSALYSRGLGMLKTAIGRRA